MDPELFIDTLRTEERQFATFLLHLFKSLEHRLMTDFTAFNAALADLQAKVDANTATIAANTTAQQALSTEINNVISILKSGSDQSTIDTAVAALQVLSSKAATQAGGLAAEGAESASDLAALQAADGSAPAPAPAPTPAPPAGS